MSNGKKHQQIGGNDKIGNIPNDFICPTRSASHYEEWRKESLLNTASI